MSDDELRRLIGQCLMVGLPGPRLDDGTRALLVRHRIGNVVLFGRNTPDPTATLGLTRALQELVRDELGSPMLIAADHEGGAVQRLAAGATRIPSAMCQGLAGPGHVTAVSRVAARELLEVGINMVLAPVADVNVNPDNPVIGVRSFGDVPETVATCVAAALEGYQAEGIVTSVKHFPGHGDTGVDSHLDLPVLPFDLERLDRVELVPFRAAIAAGVDSVMVSHLALPRLDPSGMPATLSPVVTAGLLRERLGYEGVICTDCMEMSGVTSSHPDFGEIAVRAFEAGADLVVVSHTPERQEAAARSLIDAVRTGRVAEERLRASASRIAARKRRLPASGSALGLRDIGGEAHRQVIADAAGAAVRLVTGGDALPLPGPVGVLSFGRWSHTQAEDATDADPFLEAARTRGAVPLDPGDLSRVESLLIGVRRLTPAELDAVRHLTTQLPSAVVALREPYVLSTIPRAATVIACDESPETLAAILQHTLPAPD
jgi:beta-N-acetylhexosaminidase